MEIVSEWCSCFDNRRYMEKDSPKVCCRKVCSNPPVTSLWKRTSKFCHFFIFYCLKMKIYNIFNILFLCDIVGKGDGGCSCWWFDEVRHMESL